jgi:LSD1 subclass zinc finger protein
MSQLQQLPSGRHITPNPCLAVPNPDQSQIVCNGCRVLLSYPRGAQSVQCSLCHTVTQVRHAGAVGPCSLMCLDIPHARDHPPRT